MDRNLEECTREELIAYIEKLKRQNRKRFGLVWEEKIKPEKVVEECETKLPVVKEVAEKRIENAPGESTNIIIEGDNYHALSVLNYTHAGKIDVIYIDPPYNTGNKDFIYNDCYVDKEDTFRHSKWLSFMEKRLKLAKNLLADDGVIFISIDDNEQAALKMLGDSIFGEKNYENFIWKKKGGAGNTERIIGCLTEYISCFFKKKKPGVFNYKTIERTYKYSDSIGVYNLEGIEKTNSGVYARPTMLFSISDPKTGECFYPSNGMRWTIGEKTVLDLLKDGKLYFDYKKKRVYRIKRPEDYEESNNVFYNLLLECGSLSVAKDEIKSILGDRELFDTPKPINLIVELLKISSRKDSVVLDFFAGSGTTGQAVMELNKEDGGHRQFILVTNNEASGKADAGTEGIAEKVTYPRIKTVITGIRPDGTKYSDGIPANLRYFKTDFVEKGKTTDDTREALITECCDMIRIRENAFEHVASAPEYRFYKNDKVFVPIIFDQFAIAETWELVEKLNTEKLPVHCYNFSYNRHANEEEIPEDTELTWTACSIPETVLEVYRKIFRKKEV